MYINKAELMEDPVGYIAQIAPKVIPDREDISMGDLWGIYFTLVHELGKDVTHIFYSNLVLDLIKYHDIQEDSDGDLRISYWIDTYDLSDLRLSGTRYKDIRSALRMLIYGRGTREYELSRDYLLARIIC